MSIRVSSPLIRCLAFVPANTASFWGSFWGSEQLIFTGETLHCPGTSPPARNPRCLRLGGAPPYGQQTVRVQPDCPSGCPTRPEADPPAAMRAGLPVLGGKADSYSRDRFARTVQSQPSRRAPDSNAHSRTRL